MTSEHDKAKAVLAETVKAQALASDPTASSWVSANAGAGKTHVLKQRVLRILLSGTAPDRILCLTYTKAAAAEMAGRVFKDLSRWATAETGALEADLGRVLARKATPADMALARTLFARAIETPGGLKVQTIHAFCERLLQRFPLEANVPPGFRILDDAEAAEMIREATDEVLGLATRDPAGPFGVALTRVVAFAASDQFDQLLRSALGSRDWLMAMARLVAPDAEGIDAAASLYRRALGVREDASDARLLAEMAALLHDEDLARATSALAAGSKTDVALSETLTRALKARDAETRVRHLTDAFLTQKLEARSDRFVTNAVKKDHPDIFALLSRARDRMERLVTERRALTVADASLALMRLADAVMQGYFERKGVTAALDFDDLIQRTASLLSSAEAAAWVLLKLDGGLDHILVDEAQDTSPVQWQVIEALAAEFFPVTGGQTHPRTIFAVGDEKQSIYSFQGAEPRMFALSGARFEEAAKAASLSLRRVPLTLSFRTVEPLLAAVDRVLGSRERTPGLTAGDEPIRHVALRLGHAGLVEIWDTVKPEDAEEGDAWQPLGEATVSDPVTRLAERIADTIDGWLDSGERLASEGRPIRAGDILILLRRRNPFAGPMVAALKRRNIPVAGADRLKLIEQIAVQDLMVLGDFLTLPEDDLALATVLKSPLFDLDDDDLLEIAAPRRGAPLWFSLLAAAKTRERFVYAAETLKRWRGIADQSPPFEFYAHVLDRDGGRKRLISRLGPESVEAITEFLNLAVKFDEAETPSLTGFLAWTRSGTREIKRDMEHGRDEVRVLTVHGAKGLEAPIVFLPDTCSALGGPQQGRLVGLDVVDLGPDEARPVAWPVKGTSSLGPIRDAKSRDEAAERDESHRLLYVAMTRARDRLYVAGWDTRKARPKGCWYDLVRDGLEGVVTPARDPRGEPVLRHGTTQTVPPDAPSELTAGSIAALEPPPWARQPAPKEGHVAVPIAPSRLHPYDVDETGDPVPAAVEPADGPPEPAAPSPFRLVRDYRFQRGLVTHALLQHLPSIPADRRREAAVGFTDTRGEMLPSRIRASIIDETLAVLDDPAFADAFGPDSRAEVPLVAEIPHPDGGKRAPVRLNAVIDRLVVKPDAILVIDYKTNRPPPLEARDCPKAYLIQLAAYRLALRQIHPDRPVRAAILWTDGARLMDIPSVLLDVHERELWQLASARLDG